MAQLQATLRSHRLPMPTINNPELTVTTNRPVDRAAVIVTCDVDFTDVEVNAMNMLGLQYSLTCEVFNKELLDEDLVIPYAAQQFPIEPGHAHRSEHVVFDTHEYMDTLHERLIGKDQLLAKLTLTNEETHASVTAQTEVISVDLAA
jgi:hypothetical protein